LFLSCCRSRIFNGVAQGDPHSIYWNLYCRRGFIDEFRKRQEVVFRYHFILGWPNKEHGDEEGTLLPDDASVRHYAEHVIHELKHSGDGYDDPGLCMIATNEAGNELFVIPFETRR